MGVISSVFSTEGFCLALIFMIICNQFSDVTFMGCLAVNGLNIDLDIENSNSKNRISG